MADIQSAQNTLSQLKDQVRQISEGEEKHLRWAFGIKLVVLAFVIGYLTFAYVNFKPVDAQFIVFMAQDYINEALPEAKAQMKDWLVKRAPTVVDQMGDEVVKSLPAIGMNAELAAKRSLTDLGNSLEKDVVAWVAEFIQMKKEFIDEMFPDMSSFEKITAMRKFILEDTHAAVDGMTYEVSMSVKKHPFIDQLRHLAQGRNLTEKEKLQREVLALWYVLIQKKIDEL